MIRIFPALIAVLIFCLAFGWLALLADEYTLLAKHTLAGSAFIPNLIFWSEASYFDIAAQAKPLLHLWSLGIEEQFYLAWPLMLLLLWRTRTNLSLTIATLAALSFTLNMYQAAHNPTADFYSPLSRLWELLAGAMLACTADKMETLHCHQQRHVPCRSPADCHRPCNNYQRQRIPRSPCPATGDRRGIAHCSRPPGTDQPHSLVQQAPGRDRTHQLSTLPVALAPAVVHPESSRAPRRPWRPESSWSSSLLHWPGRPTDSLKNPCVLAASSPRLQ